MRGKVKNKLNRRRGWMAISLAFVLVPILFFSSFYVYSLPISPGGGEAERALATAEAIRDADETEFDYVLSPAGIIYSDGGVLNEGVYTKTTKGRSWFWDDDAGAFLERDTLSIWKITDWTTANAAGKILRKYDNAGKWETFHEASFTFGNEPADCPKPPVPPTISELTEGTPVPAGEGYEGITKTILHSGMKITFPLPAKNREIWKKYGFVETTTGMEIFFPRLKDKNKNVPLINRKN